MRTVVTMVVIMGMVIAIVSNAALADPDPV